MWIIMVSMQHSRKPSAYTCTNIHPDIIWGQLLLLVIEWWTILSYHMSTTLALLMVWCGCIIVIWWMEFWWFCVAYLLLEIPIKCGVHNFPLDWIVRLMWSFDSSIFLFYVFFFANRTWLYRSKSGSCIASV